MADAESNRPDPEQMLARIQTEELAAPNKRGRLKVFFGYAPGVGKTYTMLEDARARAIAGVDVVLGYVEPHGREETEVLLLGQELLPPREIQHRGITLREFDLDAALDRKPALIAVDELAHTNAPGLRHAKRWQDIRELLDAGIDVYTTVNVQHVESLNDIVAQITGVRVRETVPDDIFDAAEEVELIDLPPDDLLERMAAGKVYLPEQAARAADRFFRKPNLLALRELALRKTADRVNVDVQTARRGQTTSRTWPTRERLLVCVGPSPTSAKVIRSAKRLTRSLSAEWIAIAVEVPGSRLSDADERRLKDNLQLAERLGAQTVTLTGDDVARQILDYANSRNVTKIVIGKTDEKRRRSWRRLPLTPPRQTVVDAVLAESGEIDVYVIRGFGDVTRSAPSISEPTARQHRAAVAAGAVAAAFGLALLFEQVAFSQATTVMVLLLGVTIASIYGSRISGTVAAVVASLLFNFFFTEPFYTFAISDTQDVVTFAVMLVIASVVSSLSARVRAQADAASNGQRRTEALYRLSRRLVGAATRDEVVRAAQDHVEEATGYQVALLLAEKGQVVPAGRPPEFILDPGERAAAQWVFEHGQPAGRGTDTLPNVAALYLPLEAPGERLGVLATRSPEAHPPAPGERQTLETFATQVALALQREELADEARRVLLEAEAERTRSSLLSSVSHDLRTPLSVIAGASSSLLEPGDRLDPPTRRTLVESIHDEATRMTSLVENLLHLTRLESGKAEPHREWHPLDEVVGPSISVVRPHLGRARIQTRINDPAALVHVDAVLVTQAIVNLLDNAVKYGGADAVITLSAVVSNQVLQLTVEDDGPGLPEDAEGLFSKFVRGLPPESSVRGSGLGLAICKAVAEVHGGSILGENRAEGGARMTMLLPYDGTPPVMEDDENLQGEEVTDV